MAFLPSNPYRTILEKDKNYNWQIQCANLMWKFSTSHTHTHTPRFRCSMVLLITLLQDCLESSTRRFPFTYSIGQSLVIHSQYMIIPFKSTLLYSDLHSFSIQSLHLLFELVWKPQHSSGNSYLVFAMVFWTQHSMSIIHCHL